ncbi:hypothetical protein JNB11_02465 [Kocuria palustris]|nr:hypothetical protein [Kocuria palustris]
MFPSQIALNSVSEVSKISKTFIHDTKHHTFNVLPMPNEREGRFLRTAVAAESRVYNPVYNCLRVLIV